MSEFERSNERSNEKSHWNDVFIRCLELLVWWMEFPSWILSIHLQDELREVFSRRINHRGIPFMPDEHLMKKGWHTVWFKHSTVSESIQQWNIQYLRWQYHHTNSSLNSMSSNIVLHDQILINVIRMDLVGAHQWHDEHMMKMKMWWMWERNQHN